MFPFPLPFLFQFQLGAIKSIIGILPDAPFAFQFQLGAIKSGHAFALAHAIGAFQFQLGAIKSRIDTATIYDTKKISIPTRCD